MSETFEKSQLSEFFDASSGRTDMREGNVFRDVCHSVRGGAVDTSLSLPGKG